MSGHLFEVVIQFWVDDGKQDEMRAKLLNPKGNFALMDEVDAVVDDVYVDNIMIKPVEIKPVDIRNILVDGN